MSVLVTFCVFAFSCSVVNCIEIVHGVDRLKDPFAPECPPEGADPTIKVVQVTLDKLTAEPTVQHTETETWNSFRPLILTCAAAYPVAWDFLGNKVG